MGDFDGHTASMGDWAYPPGPGGTFSSLLNDDSNVDCDIEKFLQDPEGEGAFEFPDTVNQSSLNIVPDENVNFNVLAESQTSNRGGLNERIAARRGFNAEALRLNTEITNNPEMPCWTTTPDFVSPSVLLDSPAVINNPQVLPSPTVGKYTFPPGGNNQNSAQPTDDSDKENTLPGSNASPFGFNNANSFTYLGAADRVNSNSGFPPESFVGPNVPDTSLQPQTIEELRAYMQSNPSRFQQANFSMQPDMNGGNNLQTHNAGGLTYLSPSVGEPQAAVVHGTTENTKANDDGYYWRKYGQKQLLGSEFPRSYYRCAITDCPVRKQVQRSAGGQNGVTYRGYHNHPKSPSDTSPTESSPALGELQQQYGQLLNGVNGDPAWSSMNQDNLDPTYSFPQGQQYEIGPSSMLQAQNVNEFMNGSSTFSSGRDDCVVTHHSVPSGFYGAEQGTPLRKRKTQCYTPDMGASRSSREPKIVIQTKSEVDMLDDGYRWRKYGQKVVHGNPNPRSYYKCTSHNCNVRKHIERAASDLEFVITTYEGLHRHGLPASRHSLYYSTYSNLLQAQRAANNSTMHEPTQVHNGTSQFERQQRASSVPAGSPQIGPYAGFTLGFQ